MSFWSRKAPAGPVQATRAPRPPDPGVAFGDGPYYCLNDGCDGSIQGYHKHQLAYGCIAHKNPLLFKDLEEAVRVRINGGTLGLCYLHTFNPMTALCPVETCLRPVYANTTPVGLWAPPFSGKTVTCVALKREVDTLLLTRTGVVAVPDLEHKTFPVIPPSGELPLKSKKGQHHTVRYRLSRPDWNQSKRITLTDMAGEYFDDFYAETPGDDRTLRQQLIFRTREAIYLIDPETAEGVGAEVDRAVDEPLKATFSAYAAQDLLRGATQSMLDHLLLRQLTIFRARRYPPGGADSGGRYAGLARHLVSDVDAWSRARGDAGLTDQRIQGLVGALDRSLTGIAQVSRPSAREQLNGLTAFLEQWAFPRGSDDRRFELRLALTIAKADLLRCPVPDAEAIMKGVRRDSPWAHWRARLLELSDASREVLERYEPNLVATAQQSFRDVGFFFISSLGRPVDYVVEQTPDGRIDVTQRLGRDAGGARPLTPRGVLWPVLWAAGGGA